MKEILRKGIVAIRTFLDRAEASLDEPRQMKEETALAQDQVPEEVSCSTTSPEEKELLVPFSKGNFSGTQSTYKDRKTLNALLDEWVHISGMEAKEAKAMLRKHSSVQRIDYMTVGQVDEACGWLREQIVDAQKQP